MAQTVEIRLRIPSLRVHREGKEGMETIVNSEVRFSKQIEVEAIPKVGEELQMSVGSAGTTFTCRVVRCAWEDDKNMFVVACQYSKRSISPAEYQAFFDESGWHVQPLL